MFLLAVSTFSLALVGASNDREHSYYKDDYSTKHKNAHSNAATYDEDAKTVDKSKYSNSGDQYYADKNSYDNSYDNDYSSKDSTVDKYEDEYEKTSENFHVLGHDDRQKETYAIDEAENYVKNSKDCDLYDSYEKYGRDYSDSYSVVDVNDVFGNTYDITSSSFDSADVYGSDSNLRGSSKANDDSSSSTKSSSSKDSKKTDDSYASDSASAYYDDYNSKSSDEYGKVHDSEYDHSYSPHAYGGVSDRSRDYSSYGTDAKYASDSSKKDSYDSDYDSSKHAADSYDDYQSAYDNKDSSSGSYNDASEYDASKKASTADSDYYKNYDINSNDVLKNSKDTYISDNYLNDEESLDCDVSSDKKRSYRNYDEVTETRDFAGGDGKLEKTYESGSSSAADYYDAQKKSSDSSRDWAKDSSKSADKYGDSTSTLSKDKNSLYQKEYASHDESKFDRQGNHARDSSYDSSFGGNFKSGGGYGGVSAHAGDSTADKSGASLVNVMSMASLVALAAFNL